MSDTEKQLYARVSYKKIQNDFFIIPVKSIQEKMFASSGDKCFLRKVVFQCMKDVQDKWYYAPCPGPDSCKIKDHNHLSGICAIKILCLGGKFS